MPVTQVETAPCFVVQVKNKDKDGYDAVQLGWGDKKLTHVSKPLQGHFKGAGLKKAPFYLREIRMKRISKIKPGDEIKVDAVFKPGDRVRVTGWSKGKGFAGVMKRWGFAGGPATHGQSDRPRSPGSIGLGTTPGRVFKGKKMAGRMGGQKVTISGLVVTGVDKEEGLLEIRGLLPGATGNLLIIRRENA